MNPGKARVAAPTRPVPTVSITTPSRNQGRFLEDTIKSVLSQEGDFAIDYILVDGGSTDNSVEVIKKYESLLLRGKWPIRCSGIRFRWLSERDEGQSDAINKGLRMSTGDVMAWLNSDDTYTPDALRIVCETFSQDASCDVVYGKTYYVDQSGARLGQYPTEDFCHERLAIVNFICQPSTFFRRSALERAGYPDANLRYVMDYDLWIRMAAACRFRYLADFLSHYRLHGESKTVSGEHALGNSRECLEVVYKYFHWAPANRVYDYCTRWYQAHVTKPVLKKSPIEFCLIAPCAAFKYCAMNRGIRLADVKQLSLRNLRNLLVARNLF
jgi:glycosyltransferase involved in cell wall biosynthesis